MRDLGVYPDSHGKDPKRVFSRDWHNLISIFNKLFWILGKEPRQARVAAERAVKHSLSSKESLTELA